MGKLFFNTFAIEGYTFDAGIGNICITPYASESSIGNGLVGFVAPLQLLIAAEIIAVINNTTRRL
jgi:hypothetical protein